MHQSGKTKYLAFCLLVLLFSSAESAPDISDVAEAVPGAPDVPDFVPDCVVRALIKYMGSYFMPSTPSLPDTPDVDLPSVPKGECLWPECSMNK